MKRFFRKLREKLFKEDLPPPYAEDDAPRALEPPRPEQEDESPPFALDLLSHCRPEADGSDVEYAEIEDMGVWHSTPLSRRHKSKISLTWVLKENIEQTKPHSIDKTTRYHRQGEPANRDASHREVRSRVVGRNEYYHSLKFRSECDLPRSCSEAEDRRRRHRHRRKKRQPDKRFGYDIRDLDGFLSEASLSRPGNIPVVVAYPTELHAAGGRRALPLGTVVNALFRRREWLYAQTPHGAEGYVPYAACLPLGILPSRTPQSKTPCWESSTDLYPRPGGLDNLTDREKERLRRRPPRCAEQDFDDLYLRAKSACSTVRTYDKSAASDYSKGVYDECFKERRGRQALAVVQSDFEGSAAERTLSVKQGDVVVLVQGRKETEDAEWFYVRKRDGERGFIPAVVAGNGYI